MNPDFQFGQPGQPETPAQPQQFPQPAPQPMPQPAPQLNYAPNPPVNNYVIPPKSSKKWVILTIVFITTTLLALGGGAWALFNYFDQKDNVDAKVSTAVTAGVKEQADKDAAAFLEKEKQPNRQFVGPEDYGRLAFDYPKTWSSYVDKDTSSGTAYVAYFNPVSVPPVATDTQYALRVTIEQKEYEKVIASYESLVKKDSLKSSAVKADDVDGNRFDGNFTKDIRGSAVIFKIRDKTVTIRTDAETFKGDFDALIKTITFNK